MSVDMQAMLTKIKDRQWALADIDWNAPGADMITDQQRPQLKAFMAEWDRNLGEQGFVEAARHQAASGSGETGGDETPG